MKPSEVSIRKESERLADEFLGNDRDNSIWPLLVDMFESGVAFRESYITTEDDQKESKITTLGGIDTVVITKEILEQGKSSNNGWNRKQIKALGDNQDVSGWMNRLIGKRVRPSAIQLFLNLKNAHIKKKNKKFL